MFHRSFFFFLLFPAPISTTTITMFHIILLLFSAVMMILPTKRIIEFRSDNVKLVVSTMKFKMSITSVPGTNHCSFNDSTQGNFIVLGRPLAVIV